MAITTLIKQQREYCDGVVIIMVHSGSSGSGSSSSSTSTSTSTSSNKHHNKLPIKQHHLERQQPLAYPTPQRSAAIS